MTMSTPVLHRSLNILLAFDGSQHCLSALDLLRDLPLPVDSKVTVVGVLIPRESSNHAVLEAALDQAEQMLKEKGVDSRSEIIVGNPAETIIEFANQIHPDLIVAGAKGLRHTLGILLGGVAQQIVEYSGQPVLVVRAPYKGLKHILLVTDGSPSSQAALEYLAGVSQGSEPDRCERFPLPPNILVSIMHVLPPPPSPELLARSWPIGPDVLPPIPLDREAEAAWLKEEETRGTALLDRTISSLKKCSGIQAIPVLTRGDAATEIIQYAKDHQIDLIVAGSRGLSEMRSWLLGSVSRKLVHYANCSVLIIKGHPSTHS
jgi:nucleotide-binding universal stress UspA family protein